MSHHSLISAHAGVYRSSRSLALWRVVQAELLKQHRILFGSPLVSFSMLVWPALQLGSAYYAFLPFLHTSGLVAHWSLAADARTVLLFFITGMLGYNFFAAIVQSSWQFSFERFHGTLEILFLTPANRLVLILANGVGALIQSVWFFLIFATGLIVFVGGLHMSSPAMFLVAFLGLLIPAVCWAAFLNSVCIFARDSSFVYTILESTMAFFSGVRIPLLAFPLWIRIIGSVLPLTTSLIVLRGALLSNETLLTLWPSLLFLASISLAMLLLAIVILKKGEEHARLHGTLTLF